MIACAHGHRSVVKALQDYAAKWQNKERIRKEAKPLAASRSHAWLQQPDANGHRGAFTLVIYRGGVNNRYS